MPAATASSAQASASLREDTDLWAPETLVQAVGLGVRKRDQWLVRDVSLTLRRGQIVSLIGPNGAGKSTLAQVIAGSMQPTVGRLKRGPNLKIGYVPQRLSIDPTLPLTVRGLFALTDAIPRHTVEEALARVDVPHLLNASVQTLSGGEFQRVLVARAIARAPDLLVLDEPANGVDVSGEAALYDLIAQTRDRLDCGVLLVSHDLHVVMAKTDHVLCLSGHVCCSGPPVQVAQSAPFQALFGRRGHQAVALYQHRHNHAHAADGTVVPLPVPQPLP